MVRPLHFRIMPTLPATPPSQDSACCTRCSPSCQCAVPSCLDTSLSRTSDHGSFRVELVPDALPIPLGTATSWTLNIAGPDSRPLPEARLTLIGGKPQHGARLPVASIAPLPGAGTYRITFLQFDAPGWWILHFTIASAAGADTVTFNLALA